MNEPISKKHLSAVISFEDSTEKLSSCLQALVNWVPKIIVVLPDGEDIAKQIIDEFRVSVCVNRASTTQTRWEQGLSQISSHWVLLMRSNEIITGKLRKEITDKVKSQESHFVRYPLSPTIVFLKKQLKYLQRFSKNFLFFSWFCTLSCLYQIQWMLPGSAVWSLLCIIYIPGRKGYRRSKEIGFPG